MSRPILSVLSGCAAILAVASAASASVNVINAHLVNTYSYTLPTYPTSPSLPPAGATVVLDSSAPGNAFNTLDVNGVGFTSSIDPSSGGFFRLNATGTALADTGPTSNSYIASTSGTLQFTADAPFSVARGIVANEVEGPAGEGHFTLTSLSSGQSLTLAAAVLNPPVITGDLPAANIPAGTYQLDFSLIDFRNVGVARPVALQLDLATTPEPATLAVLACPALLMRRRRR